MFYSEMNEHYKIYLRSHENTSLESTAAYIMSIHPLNVACQKRHIIKYICRNQEQKYISNILNSNLESQIETDACFVEHLVHRNKQVDEEEEMEKSII